MLDKNETGTTAFDAAFSSLPLVAILRGVKPDEVEPIGRTLYEEGFRLIEVPLNSPEPFESIARLARALPQDAVIGAGTVIDPADVARVKDGGGRLIVMPHGDVAVIHAAKAAGMWCLPGVSTPTEAFAAIAAGADAIKIFPAEVITPVVLRAMRAVLPPTLRVLPVGGIKSDTMQPFLEAGANGFGLGSALYAPGMTAATVGERARAFVSAWQALRVE
jgi:2-dehydro-3-deoxyphosphogalactonate aldolase